MYWRKSSIGVDNVKLPDPHMTCDLYLSTDDYAPFIKYDAQPGKWVMFPWCVMLPKGTQYGAELLTRHALFVEAFEMLKSYIELREGT